MTASTAGRLIGVGVGPGDPELLTLKAVRALQGADVVAYFAKAGNDSNARASAAQFLRADSLELPLLYPITIERPTTDLCYQTTIEAFFDESAAKVAHHLEAGRVVAVLSEGDALFFGSYMHLHVRLAKRFPTQVIPGITAMSGGWAAAGLPIVQGNTALTVLAGTLEAAELVRRFQQNDSCVVMKLGRNLPKVRQALLQAGRLAEAIYVERATTTKERLLPLIDKHDDIAPYFALVLVAKPWWQ